MKILAISCLAALALVSLSACKTVEGPTTQSTTTTTEETTVQHPVTTTTETQTTRTY